MDSTRVVRTVTISEAVWLELTAASAPLPVFTWAQSRPAWLVVKARVSLGTAQTHLLTHLDAGEREAISLAQREPDSLLLIDERAGRKAASELGVAMTGTVGVLVAASRAGLLHLPETLVLLRRTNFRIGDSFLRDVLAGEGYPPQ